MQKNKLKTILIIDGGGRAHILAKKYSESKFVDKVLIAPGNDLISDRNPKLEIFKDVKTTDLKKILNLANKLKPDIIDVAQDDAVAVGVTDALRKNTFKVLGPSKLAGRIEWDKAWSRRFMKGNNLPIPSFKTCNSESEGKNFIKKQKNSKWFIKASGLAGGKGAIFAKNNNDALSAISKMKQFGDAGKIFLIEEFIEGEEFSAFALVSGKQFKILGYAQDHKRVFDGDRGANTGGMGCSSPPMVVTKKVKKQTEEIFKKTIDGLSKLKIDYVGILYLGAMVDRYESIKIIEFNARWGDPEAQVLIPSIKNDFFILATAAISKQLKDITLKKDNSYRITVAISSKGYPGNYKKLVGKKISSFERILKNKKINIYGANVKKIANEYFIDGGRLFYVTSEGDTVHTARKMAYNALSTFAQKNKFIHYRRDIGYRDVKRLND